MLQYGLIDVFSAYLTRLFELSKLRWFLDQNYNQEGRKQWVTNVSHVLAGSLLQNTCQDVASGCSPTLAFPNTKRNC